MNDKIIIKGAKEHNLKNIDLEIPRDKLVVITGLSGSGKSSLAFDTLYAEGQRRYVESLSSYARQFLGLMEKPDVERIDGLSPAISIDQKTTSKNPRSTVGTVTEIYDYIRLLYARIGVPYCPNCHKKIEKQTIDQVIDNIMRLPEGTKIQVMAPVVRGRKGEYTKQMEEYQKEGFVRARIDGEVFELSDDVRLKVIYPKECTTGGNPGSLVILLECCGKSFLFTGDIGSDTEELLIEQDLLQDVDILKVSHHGSKYSSTDGFLAKTSPEVSVISVGRNNLYGHPSPKVLERLDYAGSTVYRTDEDGAVIFEFY